jgi:hypothetical protein
MKVGDLVIYFWDDLEDDDVKLWTIDSVEGVWVHLLGDYPESFTTIDKLEVVSASR